MDKYKVVFTNSFIEGLLKLLVDGNFLEKIEDSRVEEIRQVIKNLPVPESKIKEGYLGGQEKTSPCVVEGVDRFLNNHQAIEVNFETISRENLGLCEDRKDWLKPLKAAVKEFGHDELLEAFYNWTVSIGTFMGRRPVGAFLKNPGNHIGSVRTKPQVTNPALSRVEERIAYVSDNKVFFTGDYRIKLAALIKDFSPELVLNAFENFFQDLDDKGIQWAAREFLQRASVMITTIQRKKQEAETKAKLEAAAYAAAKDSVEDVVEEESEEL